MSAVSGLLSKVDWEARVRDLWALLDDVRSLGFSLDPRDVLDNLSALWDLVERGWELMTEPPPGDPAAVAATASGWMDLRASLDTVADRLTTQRSRVPSVWEGDAADACTSSVAALGASLDDAAQLAGRAARALTAYGDELTTARSQHGEVGDHLRSAAAHIRPCAPWDVPEMLGGLVGGLTDAVRAALDAYSTAVDAARECERVLDVVVDQMPFPDGVVGLTPVELLNLAGRPGQETRPLVGDTARRAQDAYDALPAGERDVVDSILARAPGPEHRAWILAALAAGADPGTLVRFAGRIEAVEQDDLPAVLDPTSSSVTGQRAGAERLPVLHQATDTTCGSASLIVARMLADPVYALQVLDGYDASSGTTDPGGSTPEGIAARFGREEILVQTRTNAIADRSSDVWVPPFVGTKMPWPKALGTPPWGASEEMNNGAGVPGTSYHVSMVDSDSVADGQQSYDEVARAVDSGRPVPLYTGSDNAPRHVVLAVGRTSAGDLEIFNPATGAVSTVSESGFVAGGDEMDAAGSWPRVWAAVTP